MALANGLPQFDVFELAEGGKTLKAVDEQKIALTEEWAKRLMYCDMDGFALTQEGDLILIDECGNFAYCPEERFVVIFRDDPTRVKVVVD